MGLGDGGVFTTCAGAVPGTNGANPSRSLTNEEGRLRANGDFHPAVKNPSFAAIDGDSAHSRNKSIDAGQNSFDIQKEEAKRLGLETLSTLGRPPFGRN